MRLTLRTLLAYLDEILDPHDAEILRQKIQDSEFATSLVHQIRGSVRRLRLDAPALDAQGIGGDLNSISEYLDNTLPPDQVPSLEKVCLDNEIHLGEVASCHQILTLVLGEAAPVNDRMRHRAYGIAPTNDKATDNADEPASQSGAPPSAPAAHDPAEQANVGALPTTHITTHAPHPDVPSPASPAIVGIPVSPTDRAAAAAALAASAAIAANPSTAASLQSPPNAKQPGTAHQPPVAGSATSPVGEATTRKQRPSDQFTTPIVTPSTKEAWRAEARQVSPAIAPPSDRVGVVAATGDRPVQPLRPEYMESNGAWLRRGFLVGLVALLIMAALFFATGNNSTFISKWFRGPASQPEGSLVAQSTLNDTLTPQTATQRDQPQLAEIEVVETTRSWNTAESGFQSRTPDALAGSELSPPTIESQRHVDIRPPATAFANEFDNIGIDAAPIPNERALRLDESDLGQLPSVEPEGALAATPTTSSALPDVGSQRQAPMDNGSFRLDLPRKNSDTISDVPPAPPTRESTISRTGSVPSIPSVASTVPLVDPGLDATHLNAESTSLKPPVASLATTTPSESLTTRLPAEPVLPDPEVVASLGPTKLRAADQLLLLFDEQDGDWRRVDSKMPLGVGSQLLGLPAFQADVEIGTSILCSMIGPTRMQLGPAADLTLQDGNLLLRNRDSDVTQGFFYRGDRLEINFADDNSVIGIEAYYQHIPGSEITEAPHSILKIYAIKRDAELNFLGRARQINEGDYLLVFDDYQPQIFTGKPKWMQSRTVSNVEKRAASLWKKRLANAGNMRAWLKERATNRNYNERALAARCLAEINEFDAIVAALNDSEQRAFWDQHCDTLRNAIARGPEATEALQRAFSMAHGSDKADFLMAMVRGFDGKQLAEGAATRLVRYLDSGSLDHRVLAFQNLKMITGATQSYRPEKPLEQLRRPVNGWKNKLRDGKIKYAKAPEIVTMLESFIVAAEAE